MILLICGGREFNDFPALCRAMELIPKPLMIIHGDARGADTLAKQWAILNGVHYAAVPALWDYYNNRAGSLRNFAMTLLQPTRCLALPGGSGTADMIRECNKANIPVWEPYQ